MTWLHVVVHTLRHHPVAKVAEHFRYVDTYHLSAMAGVEGFFTAGVLDLHKVRLAFEESCAVVVGKDQQRISRAAISQAPLLYFNATIGESIFKTLAQRGSQWRDFLPSYAEHFMDPVSRGRASEVVEVKAAPKPFDYSFGILLRTPGLSFLADQTILKTSTPEHLARQALAAFMRLRTSGLTEALTWWRTRPESKQTAMRNDVFTGYAVVMSALLAHPVEAVRKIFKTVSPRHYPLKPRAFWSMQHAQGRINVREALIEAIEIKRRSDAPEERDLPVFLRSLSRQSLEGAPLRHGARVATRLFTDNPQVNAHDVILDALGHHPMRKIRELAMERGHGLFADPSAKIDRIEERRAAFILAMETWLDLVGKRRNFAHYTRQVDQALRADLHDGLLKTVRQCGLDVHLYGPAGILGHRQGGVIAAAIDALRHHPDSELRAYYADLDVHHFAYRKSIFMRADGKPDWARIGHVLFEAHRVKTAAAMGVDVRHLDHDTAVTRAWDELPNLRAAKVEGSALLYGASIGIRLLRTVGDSNARIRDAFHRAICERDAEFIACHRHEAHEVAHVIRSRRYRHIKDPSIFASAADVGLQSAIYGFDQSLGVPFGAYLRLRVKGQIKDDLRTFDPFNLRLPGSVSGVEYQEPEACDGSEEADRDEERREASATTKKIILNYGLTPRMKVIAWMRYIDAQPQVRIAKLLKMVESAVTRELQGLQEAVKAKHAVEQRQREESARRDAMLTAKICDFSPSERVRAVLKAALIEGKQHKDIAAALGLSKSAISVNVLRFRRHHTEEIVRA